jgi:HD-like signal output (HDOD) protein
MSPGVERSFHAVEEEILGISHAEIGAYLLGLWGISYPIVEAVAHHHHPGRVLEQPAFGVLGATHVADVLAREQIGGDPGLSELDEPYLQALGVAENLPEWRAIAAAEAGIEPEAA